MARRTACAPRLRKSTARRGAGRSLSGISFIQTAVCCCAAGVGCTGEIEQTLSRIVPISKYEIPVRQFPYCTQTEAMMRLKTFYIKGILRFSILTDTASNSPNGGLMGLQHEPTCGLRRSLECSPAERKTERNENCSGSPFAGIMKRFAV